MLMEGTGKYFGLLFLVFLIVYITVKICLGFLLKRAKLEAWKGYVPIYTTLVLVDLLKLNRKYFYYSLIPFVNLYFLYIIIRELLKGFNENPDDAIWYVVFPMYNFPKLVFKRPRFVLNEYDLTEEFVKTQNILFEPDKEVVEPVTSVNEVVEPNIVTENMVQSVPEVQEVVEPVQNTASIFDNTIQSEINNSANNVQNNSVNMEVNSLDNQQNNLGQPELDSVFTNQSLQPDETHMTYVEVKSEEPKEEKPIITPVVTGRPKMCPNCGAKLAPSAEVCFLCGTKL